MAEMLELSERLKRYEGEPISMLCARYWYRGVLSEVGKNYVVLSNPYAIEVTGSSQNEAPEREDALPSDIIIRLEFIEMVTWPTWVGHLLDKKSIEQRKKDFDKAMEDRKSGKKTVVTTGTSRRS